VSSRIHKHGNSWGGGGKWSVSRPGYVTAREIDSGTELV
jgi:hypothetical protein